MAILRGVGRFFHFWYDFIVGDDWTVAASICVALVVTAVLNQARVVAWWILPLTVIVTVGISLRRASPVPKPQAQTTV